MSTTTSTNHHQHPRDKTPYSRQQLHDALDSLLEGSSDPDADASHIVGYRDPNHELSMLQIITATRILDYQQQQAQQLPQVHHATSTNCSSTSGSDPSALPPRQHFDKSEILNLQTVIQAQAPSMALAAEFKRASPSKGQLATSEASRNAGQQAIKYATAGACIISVLTEPRWFQGSLEDLYQVRVCTSQLSTGPSRPAILRKDFCISTTMIDEAVQFGADTVLLIVAVLPAHLLQSLIDYCRTQYNNMEPLVEVHTNAELHVAVHAGARVLGVNNRNLHTFQLDMHTSTRIATELALLVAQQEQEHSTTPEHTFTLCALSGMSTAEDVDLYRQAGIHMCLIGESLMRAVDPRQLIANLCLHPDDYYKKQRQEHNGTSASDTSTSDAATKATIQSSSCSYTKGLQLIKVCGITSVEDALVACRAGANLIGVIFADRSPRKVTVDQAKMIVQSVRQFGERDCRLNLSTTSTPASSTALDHLIVGAQALANATRRTPGVVGVFQNQEMTWIRSVVDTCGLDLVQLHGHEGMAAANPTNFGGVPAIRVVDIPVNDNGNHDDDNHIGVETKILESLTNDPIAILLDTSIKGRANGGGTGKSFDWSVAARLQTAGLPVIIAGGLSADTVADCCTKIRPLGVDVSSGVESSPGIKDHNKVLNFLQAARQAS